MVSDDVLSMLVTVAAHLRALKIAGCALVSSRGLRALEGLSLLKELDVSHMHHLRTVPCPQADAPPEPWGYAEMESATMLSGPDGVVVSTWATSAWRGPPAAATCPWTTQGGEETLATTRGRGAPSKHPPLIALGQVPIAR